MTKERIREIRENAGMTQAEFAKELCVSLRIVQYWEAGKSKPRALSVKMMEENELKRLAKEKTIEPEEF